MEYTTEKAFDKRTGESYVGYWFNDCKLESRSYLISPNDWTHDHEQYWRGYGWMPLDD